MDESSSAGDWSQWFRNISSDAVKTALGAYTYRSITQPSGGAATMGPDGRIYVEGQPTYTAGTAPATVGGMNTNTLMLMGGAVLVAALLLRR